jgi:hypothetical protein
MKDKDEDNIGHEGTILSTKATYNYKVLPTKEDTISNTHGRMDFSGYADNVRNIEIGAMHPNVGNTLPNAHNVEIIELFIDIFKKIGQSPKAMDLPQINHNNSVR